MKCSPLQACGIMAAGTFLGLSGGGYGAYHSVMQVPVQSSTQSWQQPRTQNQVIGAKPADFYIPCSQGCPDSPDKVVDGAETVQITANNPIADESGAPQMEMAQQKFSGHGVPVVQWTKQPITNYSMSSWTRTITPDTTSVVDHYENQCNGDEDDDDDCGNVAVYADRLDGLQVSYRGDIAEQVVGNYEVPKVSFDHGVDVGGWLLGGAALGTAAGVGAGWAATRRRERESRF